VNTPARRFARTVAATLAGVAVLAASLAGCDPYAAPPRDTVTLSLPSLHGPFFRELRTGARHAADASGVRLRVVGADNRLGRQAHQLRKAVREGSDAVLVNPVDSFAADSAFRTVLRTDVPVVAVDRAVQGADVESTVFSDNLDGGMQAAEAVAEAVDGPGQVIHLQGVPDASSSISRGRGFEQAIGYHDELDVVAEQPAYYDRGSAREVTSQLLTAYPDVKAIFAENDEMALGAVDALGERAGTDVAVVGYDGIPQALRAIQAGTMDATVAQAPEQLGQTAVEQAVTAIDGGLVAPRVPIAVELVTGGNVGEYLY
jgi:ribose transport system substrate-binding protein